jgi:hypothetical protein
LVIFFLLAALVVGGATFVALTAIPLKVQRRPWKVSLLMTGIALLPFAALLALVMWIFGPADYSDPSDLAQAYRTEFGIDPSADVRDVHARQSVVGDSGAAWLNFRASKNTIDSLLVRFVSTNRATFDRSGKGGSVPGWWKPNINGVELYYVSENWSKSFSHSVAYIGVDREKQIVYFCHIGSD